MIKWISSQSDLRKKHINMDRTNLPYRKNCEGYFLYKDRVIVKKQEGYLEFPGGGVDENEDPEKALLREAYEEAGVIIEGKMKKIGVLHFIWDKEWAKTEKQKQRYNHFKGEEMHFFAGKVKNLVSPKGDSHEDGWKGEITIPIAKAIKLIESGKPFSRDIKEYREFQLKALKSLKEQ